jgi:Rrf2 family protein
MFSMRIRIQRATDLASRLIRSLDGAELATADDLATTVDTTPDMVRRVMMQLVATGWVDSTRGRNGGYRLIVPAAAVSLLDLIEAVEGPVDDGVCVLAGGPCGAEPVCAMHEAWLAARTALAARLAEIPITYHPTGGTR